MKKFGKLVATEDIEDNMKEGQLYLLNNGRVTNTQPREGQPKPVRLSVVSPKPIEANKIPISDGPVVRTGGQYYKVIVGHELLSSKFIHNLLQNNVRVGHEVGYLTDDNGQVLVSKKGKALVIPSKRLIKVVKGEPVLHIERNRATILIDDTLKTLSLDCVEVYGEDMNETLKNKLIKGVCIMKSSSSIYLELKRRRLVS